MTAFNNKMQQIAAALDAGYTKDELMRCYFHPFRQFFRKNADFFKKEGVAPDILEAIASTKLPNKAMSAQICALPFSTKSIYDQFLSQLPENTRTLWYALVWEDHIFENDVEAVFDFKVTQTVKSRYGGYEEKQVLPEFEFFVNRHKRYHSMWSSEEVELFLPQLLRKALLEYHDIPPEAVLTPVPDPLPTEYEYCTGERDILLELPRLLTYKKQDQINYTAKNRPAQNSLTKVQRNLSLNEFFSGTSEKRLKTLRTGLLAGMAAFIPTQKLPDDVPSFVRDIFRHHYVNTAITPPMTLPDLKGMGYVDDYYIERKEADLFKMLTALPANAWLSFDNIQEYAHYNLYRFRPISMYQAQQLYYEYDKEITRGQYIYIESKHNLSKFQYCQAVETPFLLGSFFLFAAFGLCDLAYDQPDIESMGQHCYSSWDGLRYVRRTPLGDYVCGLTKNYEVSGIATESKMNLSPEILMITTSEGDTSAATILEPYTERIGTNRYRTDSSFFLKNIRSKKELSNKISLFKQLIGSELPPNWQTFFQELLLKVNPFEPQSDITVLHIPSDNKPLIHLVAQDPVIKNLVIKAEGFRILVPKGNMAPLRRRLQEFGYLMT